MVAGTVVCVYNTREKIIYANRVDQEERRRRAKKSGFLRDPAVSNRYIFVIGILFIFISQCFSYSAFLQLRRSVCVSMRVC